LPSVDGVKLPPDLKPNLENSFFTSVHLQSGHVAGPDEEDASSSNLLAQLLHSYS
jgi:hypothetical protein